MEAFNNWIRSIVAPTKKQEIIYHNPLLPSPAQQPQVATKDKIQVTKVDKEAKPLRSYNLTLGTQLPDTSYRQSKISIENFYGQHIIEDYNFKPVLPSTLANMPPETEKLNDLAKYSALYKFTVPNQSSATDPSSYQTPAKIEGDIFTCVDFLMPLPMMLHRKSSGVATTHLSTHYAAAASPRALAPGSRYYLSTGITEEGEKHYLSFARVYNERGETLARYSGRYHKVPWEMFNYNVVVE